MLNEVNIHPDYIYASPRYHTVLNYPTILIPEDYSYNDSIYGTYDLNFPLYALNQTPIPTLNIVNQESNSVPIIGTLAPYLLKENFKQREIGRKNTTTIPTNTNLDYKKVTYNQYINIKLNPAWCVVQNYDVANINLNTSNVTYQPRFIVRILGNTLLSDELYSLQLTDNGLNIYTSDFPIGLIVKYNNNLWKCVQNTSKYPPKNVDTLDNNWLNLNSRLNIFYADLFILNSNKSSYFMEVADDKRYFNPVEQDDTLVSWNLAYWEE